MFQKKPFYGFFLDPFFGQICFHNLFANFSKIDRKIGRINKMVSVQTQFQ